MSKFNIPILSARCPSCGEETSHRVTFENKRVRHLRCDSCTTAHVCAYKGSFHRTIHPIAFADVLEAGKADGVAAYHSASAFQPTDLFEHPKFGVGYVVAVLSPAKKMEVMFADKVRLLVCGLGSGAPTDSKKIAGSKASKV